MGTPEEDLSANEEAIAQAFARWRLANPGVAGWPLVAFMAGWQGALDATMIEVLADPAASSYLNVEARAAVTRVLSLAYVAEKAGSIHRANNLRYAAHIIATNSR